MIYRKCPRCGGPMTDDDICELACLYCGNRIYTNLSPELLANILADRNGHRGHHRNIITKYDKVTKNPEKLNKAAINNIGKEDNG